MVRKKRLKDHKQQSMRRRLTGGKKPMSAEQKKAQKKIKEAQRKANLASKKK